MKTLAKRIVSIFDGNNSLYAFLDDRLIYLRNNDCCREVHLLFANNQEQQQTLKFLSANNYNVYSESKCKLKIEFADSKNTSKEIYTFLVNTKYEQDEILDAVYDLITDMNPKSSEINLYLLNSNSFFGYYKQYKNDNNTNNIGSPSTPVKMNNLNKKPF